MSTIGRFVVALLVVVGAVACGPTPAIERANPGSGDATAAADVRSDANFGFVAPDGGAGGASAGPPPANGQACAASQTFTAERLPLDLVILVDASGSMAEPVAGSATVKWQLLQDAVGAFVKDQESAGLGIGLQFFPLVGAGSPCTTAADCGFVGPGAPQVCEQHRACISPGMPVANAPGCSVFDQVPCLVPGARCLQIGICTISGVACAALGAVCPGGNNADLCVPEPTSCFAAEPICSLEAYAKLTVPIADLPGAANGIVRAMTLRRPGGQTPMGQGAIGALNHLRGRLQTNPKRRGAMVIATDGLPTGCGNQEISTIADSLYVARTTNPKVPTYVIGVLDPADVAQGQQDFGKMAMAGGSGAPFILSPNQDLTRKLLETLSLIRGNALACEYVIPQDGKATIDFGKVNLHFTGQSSAATGEDVPYVGRADRCDPARGGWYYDVDPQAGTPGRVIACDATCKRFQGEPTGKVELAFGCKTVVIQ